MTGLEQLLSLIACACFAAMLLAISRNRYVAEDCKAMRDRLMAETDIRRRAESLLQSKTEYRNERMKTDSEALRDMNQKHEELDKRYVQAVADHTRHAARLEEQLRRYKLAELANKPFVVGQFVNIEGSSYGGRLTHREGKIWTVAVCSRNEIQKEDYHESLLLHRV